MQPTIARSLSLVLFLVAWSAPVAADQVVATFNIDGESDLQVDLGGEGTVGRGQGFRPLVDGTLTSVALRLARTGSPSAVLTVSITDVDNLGTPLFPALASRTFPATIVPDGGAYSAVTFDLTDLELPLDDQELYAITITATPDAGSADPPSNEPFVPLRMSGSVFAVGYVNGLAVGSPDGELWLPSPSIDYAFEVRVADPVSGEVITAGGLKTRFRR